MGYEAMGARWFPKTALLMELLLGSKKLPEMDLVYKATKYDQQEEQGQSEIVPATCIGEHYVHLQNVLQNPQLKCDFKSLKKQLRIQFVEIAKHKKDPNLPYPRPIHIGFMDTKGRHRSVAVARITVEVLRRLDYKVRGLYHLSEERWSFNLCRDCKYCDVNYHEKQALYDKALQIWNSL